MKNKTKLSNLDPDSMLPEYNFTGKKGVRGKYYQTYQQGHTVKVYHENGSIIEQYFTLEEGSVMLEPDVREFFPDSESVNKALRTLIALIPKKPAKRVADSNK